MSIFQEKSTGSTRQFTKPGDSMDRIIGSVLDHAMRIMKSDFSSLQVLDESKGGLVLIGHKNLKTESAYFWRIVYPGTGATCGEALKNKTRTLISDVDNVKFIEGTGDLKSFHFSGIRAVQSTLLISSEGDFVGMISTHWAATHDFANDDFESFDELATYTADILKKKKQTGELKPLFQ